MQLLLKTIIIIALGFILLGAVGFFMQTQLEQSFGRQFIDKSQENNQYLWEDFILQEQRNILSRGRNLHTHEAVENHLQASNVENLSAYILSTVQNELSGNEENSGFRIAVFNINGNRVFNSEVRLRSRVPVPATEIEKILIGEEESLNGLGYDDQLVLLQSIIVPIKYQDEIIGAMIYSQAPKGIFTNLQDITNSDVFVVNRYNRAVAGEASPLWEEFAPRFENPNTNGLYSVIGADNEAYRIIKFPLSYMFGNLQAFGVTMDNVTEQYQERQRLQLILGLAFISIGVLIVLIAAFILWKNFRPLGQGAGFLLSLANNADISSLGNEFNDDEIGRILNSIETLRLRTIYLKRLRRSRSKQRQRVHNLLLSEMSNLANNLDDDAKRQINEDLQEMQNEIIKSQGGGDELQEAGNELIAVASAFRKLAYRVTEKQKHLNQVIRDLEDALKTEVAYLALQKELNLAHDVQLAFIPDAGLNVGNVELLGYMSPAKTVGGDLFDYFMIDEEHVGFCVGDVSDKGVPAALFMMVARIVLWLIARSEKSVAEALLHVNNAIFDNNPNNFFVSIFYGRINIKTGKMDYVCAGHPPAIYIGKNAKEAVEVETANDLVVGIFADVTFAEYSLQLNSGDCLFVYSDGISEAMDKDDNQYTPERLLEILSDKKTVDESVKETILRVIDDVKDFTGDCPQSDDITCIALRYVDKDKS